MHKLVENRVTSKANSVAERDFHPLVPVAVLGGLLAVLFWAYWNSLNAAAAFWTSPKYSHGYLVPVFTLVLLWLRRDPAAPFIRAYAYAGGGLMALGGLLAFLATWLEVSAATASTMSLVGLQVGVFGALLAVHAPMQFASVPASARWCGLALLSIGLAIRLLATYFPNVTPEMESFIPAVAGVFLLVGGWPTFRWAGPAIAFLIFMFPLPGVLDMRLLGPLQKLATEASTYCLQTMGIPAVNEHNQIAIGEVNMQVVEACSGLRMLTIFCALAVAITMVTERPLWEKIVIVLSSVPIALAVNIIRITITGIMHLTVGPELADQIFHALAGWIMMPMALGFLYLEFQVLSHLFVDDVLTGPMPIGMNSARI